MDDHYPSWYPVQIRFRDLDPLAHVNNTVYFTYFEEARSYYFDQLDTWLNEWPSREEHQEVERSRVSYRTRRITHASRRARMGVITGCWSKRYLAPMNFPWSVEIRLKWASV